MQKIVKTNALKIPYNRIILKEKERYTKSIPIYIDLIINANKLALIDS